MAGKEPIEKIAIKNLARDYLVSAYPKVFDTNVKWSLNFHILVQTINRNPK